MLCGMRNFALWDYYNCLQNAIMILDFFTRTSAAKLLHNLRIFWVFSHPSSWLLIRKFPRFSAHFPLDAALWDSITRVTFDREIAVIITNDDGVELRRVDLHNSHMATNRASRIGNTFIKVFINIFRTTTTIHPQRKSFLTKRKPPLTLDLNTSSRHLLNIVVVAMAFK